jgi:hypothetical protein
VTVSMKSRVLRGVLVACVLSALVAPRSAEAEPAQRGEAADVARARRLFSEAIVLEDARAWSAAAEKLRQALLIKETPGLRYHLAHCEEQMGALVAASLDYERAAELLRGGAKAPDVEQLVGLASQRIAARVPKLTLSAPEGVAGLRVAIDGTPVDPSALGKVSLVDPGNHRVTATAPGYRNFSAQVAVQPGDNRTLEIELEPLPASPPVVATTESGAVESSAARAPRRDSSFGAREITLVAEAALTLAGLGVGIGYAIARADAEDEVRSAQTRFNTDPVYMNDPYICSTQPSLPACVDLQASIDRYDTATTLSTIGFVGAGVGAAAFALTWVLWPSSRKAVAVEVIPRGVGVDVRAVTRF